MKGRTWVVTLTAAIAAVLSGSILASSFEMPSLSGQLEYDSILYREQEPKKNYVNQVTLDLEASQELGLDSRLFLNGRLREDVEGTGRDMYRLREAFFDSRFDSLDVRIGRQIFAWGRTDVINPTDNFSPRNLVDLFDDDNEKLGVISASSRYYGDSWIMEAVVAPVYQRSYLAQPGTRWFVQLPETLSLPGVPGSFRTHYNIRSNDEPANGWGNTQWGLRWSGNSPGWDYALSYFDGWNDLPDFRVGVMPITSNDVVVNVQPVINRIRVLGGDVSTLVGEYTLRGEVAYVNTKDQDGSNPFIDDPYVHYVIGFDRTFSEVISGEDLFFMLEWSHQVPTTGIEYDNVNLEHVFRETLFASSNVKINNEWMVKLNAAYDFDQDGAFLKSSIIWSVVDDLSVEASLELPLGPTDSFFGSYKDNQSFRLRVQKNFGMD